MGENKVMLMRKITIMLAVLAFVTISGLAFNAVRQTNVTEPATSLLDPPQTKVTTVRTKSYPRPPYSGATYYIYERDNKIICTKVETCNKFDHCSSVYKKGEWKDQMDVEYDEPHALTDPVVIAASKLKKHGCLTKFKLLK